MPAPNAEDFAHVDRQRRRHCIGPQHPGGPDGYRYVPARCARLRGPRLPSSSSSTTRLVKILKHESNALQALRDSLVESSDENVLEKVSNADGEALRAANAAIILPLTMAFMKHVERRKNEEKNKTTFASKIKDRVDTTNKKLGKKLIWKLALDLEDYIRHLIDLITF
jgi:hypothetical protein